MLLLHLLLRFSVLLSVVQTYDHIKVILMHINLEVLTNRVGTEPLKFYGTQIIAISTNHDPLYDTSNSA